MHEYSLAECVLEEALRAADDADPKAVREVRVEWGPLSGVEPLLLRHAFDALAADRIGLDCRLVVDEAPLRARCETCREEFAPKLFDFQCPACGSTATRVTQGDGLILKSIVLDDPRGTPEGGRRDG